MKIFAANVFKESLTWYSQDDESGGWHWLNTDMNEVDLEGEP